MIKFDDIPYWTIKATVLQAKNNNETKQKTNKQKYTNRNGPYIKGLLERKLNFVASSQA